MPSLVVSHGQLVVWHSGTTPARQNARPAPVPACLQTEHGYT
jgi:hypothetical protein